MSEEKPPHYKARTPLRSHYEAMTLQPIDVMKAWLTPEQYAGFLLGNVIKYLGRYNLNALGKGGEPDLLKARDYLNRLINLGAEK